MADQLGPLLIKKYASRRLYNKETSEYITLGEIRSIIRSGREVKIVDGSTGEDLTRQYLLQIIADLESKGEPIFPVDMLTEVVRTYSHATRQALPRFLDESFRVFRENQEQFMDNFKTFGSSVETFRAMQQQNEDNLSKWMAIWTVENKGNTASETEEADSSPASKRSGQAAGTDTSQPIDQVKDV